MITLRRCLDKREEAAAVAREIYGAAGVGHLPSGAPYLVDDNDERISLNISISHTADWLAVMSSTEPCGVDIELVDRRVEHLAHRFATEDELEVARRVFPPNAALLVWCVKEAIYKMAGREGVDFLRDMALIDARGNILTGEAFGKRVELEFSVKDNLLIVNTKEK